MDILIGGLTYIIFRKIEDNITLSLDLKIKENKVKRNINYVSNIIIYTKN